MTAPHFYAHVSFTYYSPQPLSTLKEEAKSEGRPFLPSSTVKEITYEPSSDEDLLEDYPPCFQDAVINLPLLHTVNFITSQPVPASHIHTLLIARPELTTITGLVVNERNFEAVLLLLSSVASSLRHLQIACTSGQATALARYTLYSIYKLQLPRLESLVVNGNNEVAHTSYTFVSTLLDLCTMPSLRRIGLLETGPAFAVPAAAFDALSQLQSLSIERVESLLNLHPSLVPFHLQEISFTAQEGPDQKDYFDGMSLFLAGLEPLPTVRTILLRQARSTTRPTPGLTSAVIEAYLGPTIFPNLSRVVWISKAKGEACPLLWVAFFLFPRASLELTLSFLLLSFPAPFFRWTKFLVSLAKRGIEVEFRASK